MTSTYDDDMRNYHFAIQKNNKASTMSQQM